MPDTRPNLREKEPPFMHPLTARQVISFREETARQLELVAPYAKEIMRDYKGVYVNPSMSPAQFYLATAKTLRLSACVFWRTDIFISAQNNHKIFAGEHPSEDDFLAASEFWVPDRDLSISEEATEIFNLPHTFVAAGFIVGWIGQEPIMAMIANVNDEASFKFLEDAKKKYPRGFPEEFIVENAPKMFTHILPVNVRPGGANESELVALLRFRSSRVAYLERHREDRAERRRKLKANPQAKEDIAWVVTLRRPKCQTVDSGHHGDIDWQWQWIVSGHWRDQYFPSKKRHEKIFIEPYLKGPDDKPLKPHAEKMYAVTR